MASEEEAMFDVRKFWVGTSVFALMIGVVTAAVGAAFYTFIGMPTKGYQPVVTQSPPIQTTGANPVPVAIERVVPPSALPVSPSVYRKAPADIAVAMPQIYEPKPIIVPEFKSSRRGNSSR
jgi:hypothetical protein